MVLYGDYHTHTIFSHGKGTILENAIAAKSKGLKEIAITDHGFDHLLYAVKRKKIEKMREEIEQAKQITGINILLGVEANIKGLDGQVDIKPEELEKLDILLVGFHRFVKPSKFSDIFKFFLPNIFSKIFKPSEKQIKRNTKAYLNALNRYPIDILTHLNYGCPVSVKEVAKLAGVKNTLIELNGKKVCFSEEEFEILKNEKIKFVLDSDAHTPLKVGNIDKPTVAILTYDINENQIINIGDKPIKTKNMKKTKEVK